MGIKYETKDKIVLVTVGSTSFDGLIGAILDIKFIEIVAAQGYTELRIQYGKGKAVYSQKLKELLPQLEEKWRTKIVSHETLPDGLLLAKHPMLATDDDPQAAFKQTKYRIINIPILIKGFRYDPDLPNQMRVADVVISHAGE